MRNHDTLESIEKELKILDLERKIAWEEIKAVKEEYKEDLRPYNWIQTGVKLFSKFGAMILFKKIIK